jgi:hypothetical protein
MAVQKWCIINRATLCNIPKGNVLADLFLGSVIELTGRQSTVAMLGKDGKTHDSIWVEGIYQNSQGTHTGWVRDDFFDILVEKYPEPVLEIPIASPESENSFPYATRNPNDPAQYMVLGKTNRGEELVKFNLCGELCVAFVMEVEIKQFLGDWEKAVGSLFKWTLGGDSDKPTDASVIKNMLNTYAYNISNGNVVDFADSLAGPAFEGQILSAGRFQKMLQTHQLIAGVVIDKNTGKLIPDNENKRINNGVGHWVVLDKVFPNGMNGGRVELYNPYHNQRQEYSYDYFIGSFGGGTYSGCWVKRKQAQIFVPTPTPKKWWIAAGTFREIPDGAVISTLLKGTVVDFLGDTEIKNGKQWSQIRHKGKTGWARNAVLEDFSDRFPNTEVIIPHPTPEEDDAEQYMFLPGEDGKKRNMCGQLCAAFIIKVDIESFVADWKVKAKRYYELSIAGRVDRGTGIDSVESMFRVSPYNSVPGDVFRFEVGMRDPITGNLIVSAGKMNKMLENYYLLAGVRIKPDDKFTGRLGGQGIGHWVVVDKIFPNGKNGGNGGWVELYNPFPNKRQEYSYDEFMQSFAGTLGLWVKRKNMETAVA